MSVGALWAPDGLVDAQRVTQRVLTGRQGLSHSMSHRPPKHRPRGSGASYALTIGDICPIWLATPNVAANLEV